MGRSAMQPSPAVTEQRHGRATRHGLTVRQTMDGWADVEAQATAASTATATAPQPQGTATQRLNFVEMNRRAVGRGLLTARDQMHARDVLSVPYVEKRDTRAPLSGSQRRNPASRPAAGITSHKEEPMQKVLNGEYGRDWGRKHMHAEQTRRAAEAAAKRSGYGMTRTAVLRSTVCIYVCMCV